MGNMAEHQKAPQEHYLLLQRCLVTPRYLEAVALSAAGILLPTACSPGLHVQRLCDCFCCCRCWWCLVGEAAPRECSRLDAGAAGRG